MNTHRYKIALKFSMVLFFVLNASHMQAGQGESYGWLASKVDYVRDISAAGCNSDESSIEYKLAEADSKTELPFFPGTWHVYVRDAAGGVLRVSNFISTTTSSAICFNPVTEAVQVIVNDSSSHHGFIGPAITSGVELESMVGYHFRGYVHLDERSDGNQPYIVGLYPDNIAVKTNPIFFVETTRDTGIYSSLSLEDIKVYAVNLSTNTYNTVTAPASGSIGIREVAGIANLPADGNYFWVYHQKYNGTAYTFKANSVFNWTFRSLPSSGAIKPLSFIYDSTPPSINSVESVSAVTAANTEEISILVRIGVRDVTSGVATSTILVTSATGTVIAALTVPFSKQRDYIALDVGMVVPESQILNFVNVVQDDAGNVSTSSVRSFTSPQSETLNYPVVINHTVSDVRTNQMTHRAQVTSGGGSLVNTRGTCWDLASTTFPNDLPTIASSTRCKLGYSNSTGFINDIFSYVHAGMPASTTIFYRAFANNGTGLSFSPVSSTSTLNYAGATTTTATPPVIGVAYSASTTADTSRIGGRIDSTGGSPITQRGVCWALSTSSLPAEVTTSPNCYIWTAPLPPTANLPHWFDRYFYNMPFNTTIYHRAYASNAIGTTTRTSSFVTERSRLDMEVLDYALGVVYATSSLSYSINVPVKVRDISNFVIGYSTTTNYPVKRRAPYSIQIERLDGTVIDSINYPSHLVPSEFMMSGEGVPVTPPSRRFDNIPFGFVQVRVTINNGEPIYNESFSSTTAFLNNTSLKIINLTDPDLTEDIVRTGGGGFGPTLPDPGFELTFSNDVIRAGNTTNLTWDTKVNYSMQCEIRGPSTFGTNGVYSFNPATDGVIGTVSTGVLESAQIFEITCLEPITNTTFTTKTRVDVVGALKEV